MIFDRDTPMECRPPAGKWRVVEFVQPSKEDVCALSDALSEGVITGVEGDIAARGTLKSIVGDFDDLSIAFDHVALARYPNARRVFNDQGESVMGFAPGKEGQPDAGGES
ncbi:MAG TPA: hypothetical protein VMU12_01730 [Candidatus Paceibacterota bacterium]|nr:hypothetical protein [Candidatus Paceibacterota bacterium]